MLELKREISSLESELQRIEAEIRRLQEGIETTGSSSSTQVFIYLNGLKAKRDFINERLQSLKNREKEIRHNMEKTYPQLRKEVINQLHAFSEKVTKAVESLETYVTLSEQLRVEWRDIEAKTRNVNEVRTFLGKQDPTLPESYPIATDVELGRLRHRIELLKNFLSLVK